MITPSYHRSRRRRLLSKVNDQCMIILLSSIVVDPKRSMINDPCRWSIILLEIRICGGDDDDDVADDADADDDDDDDDDSIGRRRCAIGI